MQALINDYYEKYRYSRVVDFCIHWAREKISGHLPETIENLETRLDEYFNESGMAEELSQGIENLTKAVEEAFHCLGSEKSLYLTEDDTAYASLLPEEYGQDFGEIGESGMAINIALRTLDDAACLAWAVDNYPLPDSSQDIKQRVNKCISSLTTDGQPPSHRLIPLNTLRRKRLDAIPMELRFLFPWYEQFSTLPPDSLAVLAEKIAGFSCSDISPSDKAEMQLLYDAIVKDDAIYKRIIDEAVIWQELPTAFEEAWAWRLARAAARYAARFIMPDRVLDAGMVGCAIRVVCRAIADKIPTLEWRLRAAFCGLGLSEDERLALLSPVEEMMNEGDLNDHGLASQTIRQWHQGSIAEEAMAGSIFKEWLADLQQVVEKRFVRLPAALESIVYRYLLNSENPNLMASIITTIDSVFLAPGRASFWLYRALKSLQPPSGTLAFSLTMDRGRGRDEETEMQTKELSLADVLPREPLPLPEPRPGFGTSRIYLLSEEATKPLQERLGGVYFWWACMALLDGEGENDHISEIRHDRLPISITPEDVGGDLAACRIVMLAISNDKERLEQALEEQEIPPAEEGQPSLVFWITYVKETVFKDG